MSRPLLLHALALLCMLLTHGAGEAEAQTPAPPPHTQVSLRVEDTGGRQIDGSAIVWSEDGLLVTAAHVVENARRIQLIGSAEEADLVGFDPLSDIALLRARRVMPEWVAARPATSLPAVGAPVRAIGNPLGHADTLTAGVVSGLDKLYHPSSPYGLIQHDAALNPGNSGGPLLDAAGFLVGMNVAIADGSRRHVGIGFALPVAVLQRIVPKLMTGGEWPRPHLGLRLRDSAALRAAVPTLREGGLLVEEVEPGSAAEVAGLKGGDVIMAAMGRPLTKLHDLALVLEPLAPEQCLPLMFRRHGDVGVATLTLRTRPPGAAKAPPAPKPPMPLFGLVFAGKNDPVIRKVLPASPAEAAGLEPGDAVQAVGEQAVSTSAEVRAALDAAASGPVALLVRRQGRARYVILDAATNLDAAPSFGMNSEAAGSEAF